MLGDVACRAIPELRGTRSCQQMSQHNTRLSCFKTDPHFLQRQTMTIYRWSAVVDTLFVLDFSLPGDRPSEFPGCVGLEMFPVLRPSGAAFTRALYRATTPLLESDI